MKDGSLPSHWARGRVPSCTFVLAVKESGSHKELRMRSTSSFTYKCMHEAVISVVIENINACKREQSV